MKKLSLFVFIACLLFNVAGCSNNNKVVSDKKKDTVLQTKTGQNTTKLVTVKDSQKDQTVTLPPENMYQDIEVGSKKITIPAGWKQNWDYIMYTCDEKLCQKMDLLGKKYVIYCKEELKKRCSGKEKKNIKTVNPSGQNMSLSGNQMDCSNIQDFNQKKSCYLQKVESNMALKCSDIIPKNEKIIFNECILLKFANLAIKKDDITICNKLKEEKYITQCKNAYYDGKAHEKSDITLCEKITDDKQKTDCKQSISKIQKK